MNDLMPFVLMVIVLVILMLLLGGCFLVDSPTKHSAPTPEVSSDISSEIDSIKNTAHSMNWVVFPAIIGISLGVVGLFVGNKYSLAVILGSGVLLVLALTVQQYAHVLSFLGLAMGIIFVVGVLLSQWRSLKQIVGGIEISKQRAYAHDPRWQDTKRYLSETTTNRTKKLVDKIKASEKSQKSSPQSTGMQ